MAAVDAAGSTAAAAPRRPFRFLSVFKWEQRKGWDALLRAYCAEFAADEPVELLIKTRSFHSASHATRAPFSCLLRARAACRVLRTACCSLL